MHVFYHTYDKFPIPTLNCLILQFRITRITHKTKTKYICLKFSNFLKVMFTLKKISYKKKYREVGGRGKGFLLGINHKFNFPLYSSCKGRKERQKKN